MVLLERKEHTPLGVGRVRKNKKENERRNILVFSLLIELSIDIQPRSCQEISGTLEALWRRRPSCHGGP